jgi:hypothetical protein
MTPIFETGLVCFSTIDGKPLVFMACAVMCVEDDGDETTTVWLSNGPTVASERSGNGSA